VTGLKGNYKGYPDPTHVVSVEEASRLVGRKDTVFVDTRNYWKYIKGHIPGAVNLELFAFHWVDTSAAGMKAFAREMSMLLGSLGIDEETKVIFYQNNSGYDAARGVWLLEFLGNDKGRLLDGGLNLWRRQRRKLSTRDEQFGRAEFTARVDGRAASTLQELEGHVTRGDAVIIDARNPGEYNGEHRRALKLGHIPGSLNIEWKRALRKDGTLKDGRQLAVIYGGIPRDGRVVTYCQSGYRAAHTRLVLGLLGYRDVGNYLGSWYEWGNGETTSTESGKA
jgi:thiosulfate/3-mercaptopyruvate sulfurtransferase